MHKIFRKDKTPLLIVVCSRQLSSEGQANYSPFPSGQSGCTYSAILQMSLETVEREVRLVHLGVEVLTVEPGLNFRRLDLLSAFVKIGTYNSYI